MLTGLLEPTRGSVLFAGQDIREDLVGYRKCLGYVPEEPNLYPYLSGYEYLEMVGLLRGDASLRVKKRAETLLEIFQPLPQSSRGMSSYLKRECGGFVDFCADRRSQKILDEPLSGLDVTSALILKNLIKALGQKERCFIARMF
jgi:ABC-2 type transport system ATP-binding protein